MSDKFASCHSNICHTDFMPFCSFMLSSYNFSFLSYSMSMIPFNGNPLHNHLGLFSIVWILLWKSSGTVAQRLQLSEKP